MDGPTIDGPTIQSTAAADTAESLALRVVEQIATELDADPLELDPLYETIDPDALDQLFSGTGRGRSDRDGRVVFVHAGCEVTVYGWGDVDVTELPDDESDSPAVVMEEHDRPVRSS